MFFVFKIKKAYLSRIWIRSDPVILGHPDPDLTFSKPDPLIRIRYKWDWIRSTAFFILKRWLFSKLKSITFLFIYPRENKYLKKVTFHRMNEIENLFHETPQVLEVRCCIKGIQFIGTIRVIGTNAHRVDSYFLDRLQCIPKLTVCVVQLTLYADNP